MEMVRKSMVDISGCLKQSFQDVSNGYSSSGEESVNDNDTEVRMNSYNVYNHNINYDLLCL